MFLIYLEAISVSNNKSTKNMCNLMQKDMGLVVLTKQSKEVLFLIFCVGQPTQFRQGSGEILEDHPGGEEFTLKELYAVQEIQSKPNLLSLIVK